MTEMTDTQRKAISEMIEICTNKIAAAEAAKANVKGRYYLVIKDGQMVVVKNDAGIFRLNGSDAATGYQFETFVRAKHASIRWNRALTSAQREANCEVHAVSHAQYLEYIITSCTRLINTLSGHTTKQ